MKPAQESFLSVYRPHAGSGRQDAASILPYWMAAVGRQLGLRSRPLRLVKGRLIVEVDGAEWRGELIALSGLIRSRLNKLLGGPPVQYIDYRVTPLRRQPGRAETASGRAEPTDEASEINDAQLRRLYRTSMKKAR